MADELDTAFRIMSLGFNDETSEGESAYEYLDRKYDVDGEKLMEYCEGLMQISSLDQESLRLMFFMGFEFGLVYERYINDVKQLL